jgi:hypothetical protein
LSEDDALLRVLVEFGTVKMGREVGTNLGNVQIAGQKPPVDVGTVPDIRVVAVGCG